MIHQYIERRSNTIQTESLVFDRCILTLYSSIREKAPWLYTLLLSSRTSSFMGFLNYDARFMTVFQDTHRLMARLGIDPDEIYGDLHQYNTYRKAFERKICYWQCRPMSEEASCVVSPADARALPGSFKTGQPLFIKDKFFDYDELIGIDRPKWKKAFREGDFIICRLTPDKYHYNHVPVSGTVVDIYEINGRYHSCNPGAVVKSVTPYSKNRRIVTVIDTDVENGTGIGLVAMVEIVAMMIGRIVQCYSGIRYESPQTLQKGTQLIKGQPKSLFRPGSSTTVLIFQHNRIQFSQDLLANAERTNVQSRFTSGFQKPLVETEITVRQTIGEAI
ncbi:MAG: phosphatidylserine decarboxylase [Desulfobacula sp.]|jgi:phosphatidylserine decarboxylase|uniref:phosphatidylserine decarboxylase n=1 Tax=Desulfobacula sp. TaxID=2593537 RepID=UPI002A0FF430|nr:phosphatidylserine decarboxylase [Deltaproteobacteria bacterium]MBT5546466.1 phosphatidylserine decarboxylase [Desulfobacula sp.]MBT5972719.1 phosphatidylserine decarboxylase [Desulfobacula sp.]MBT6612837.1 phosphatidylserine decarboxylase [Deltaproteobacteria bacterium]MBT7712567.1 phosphatidylserine decarboxylase [Deltaproteobacteria bacterium]